MRSIFSQTELIPVVLAARPTSVPGPTSTPESWARAWSPDRASGVLPRTGRSGSSGSPALTTGTWIGGVAMADAGVVTSRPSTRTRRGGASRPNRRSERRNRLSGVMPSPSNPLDTTEWRRCESHIFERHIAYTLPWLNSTDSSRIESSGRRQTVPIGSAKARPLWWEPIARPSARRGVIIVLYRSGSSGGRVSRECPGTECLRSRLDRTPPVRSVHPECVRGHFPDTSSAGSQAVRTRFR